MVRPVVKPTKITLTPIYEVSLFPTILQYHIRFNILSQDLCATISVPADIGAEALQQMCLEKLRHVWNRWAHPSCHTKEN